ncbi:hypothetical protein [Globicatella sanguinis]|uniref:hypothetical protein n=1 Tax=Globicatella sanguinis TaxID=13076 RepID=UPI0008244614|nr:hypothetical protein [Globicatella sanguinis]
MARSKYEEWLEKDNLTRIESWASDGLTNEQIAKNIGVSRQTLDNWCKKHVDIFDAIKKGREPVVRELENALIKKAKGFEYEEVTTEAWVDDNGNKKQKVSKHKRYSPPDSSALMFLLKNYKPDKYRNYNELTKRQIEAEIKKLEAEADRALAEVEENKALASMRLVIEDDIARFDEDDR